MCHPEANGILEALTDGVSLSLVELKEQFAVSNGHLGRGCGNPRNAQHLELFLLRIALATMSNRPILVVGDLEQVRDNARRAIAVDRLGALAAKRTVVVGVTLSIVASTGIPETETVSFAPAIASSKCKTGLVSD